jgi:hypothetical protein
VAFSLVGTGNSLHACNGDGYMTVIGYGDTSRTILRSDMADEYDAVFLQR